jgi:hypothetical protein
VPSRDQPGVDFRPDFLTGLLGRRLFQFIVQSDRGADVDESRSTGLRREISPEHGSYPAFHLPVLTEEITVLLDQLLGEIANRCLNLASDAYQQTFRRRNKFQFGGMPRCHPVLQNACAPQKLRSSASPSKIKTLHSVGSRRYARLRRCLRPDFITMLRGVQMVNGLSDDT